MQGFLRVGVLDEMPLIVRLDSHRKAGLPVGGPFDLGKGSRTYLDAHLEVFEAEWLLARCALLALLYGVDKVEELALRVTIVLGEGYRVYEWRPLLVLWS